MNKILEARKAELTDEQRKRLEWWGMFWTAVRLFCELDRKLDREAAQARAEKNVLRVLQGKEPEQ